MILKSRRVKYLFLYFICSLSNKHSPPVSLSPSLHPFQSSHCHHQLAGPSPSSLDIKLPTFLGSSPQSQTATHCYRHHIYLELIHPTPTPYPQYNTDPRPSSNPPLLRQQLSHCIATQSCLLQLHHRHQLLPLHRYPDTI